jgi:hypothetical protein
MTIPNNPAPGREWTNDATGVTYRWDGDRWIVLSNSDEILEDYVTQDDFKTDQDRQDDDIAVLEGLIKGPSYSYVIDNNIGTAVSRPGQISVNSGFWSSVSKFSFGVTDVGGDTTPSMSNGDIIETYNAQYNKTNRYKITNASNWPTVVEVTYVSGDYFYGPGEGLQVVVYPDSNVATLEARVAVGETVQGYIEGEQTVQNGQINALETQVQLLAGVKAVGQWNYVRNISSGSPRPPASGTFYATHKDGVDIVLMNWADARLIMINKTDLDGTIFAFSQFQEGDKIEILAEDGSSACFGTVTNNPSEEAYGNMVISVERSNGGPPQNSLKTFLISAYRPGSSNGLVDLDVLDQRYLVKSGDTMEAPLNFQRGSKDTPQFKISPNGSEDFATNIYSLNGGDMRLRTSHTKDEGNHVGSHIVLTSNGGAPETKIYHVVETGDTGAVPRSYVDAVAGTPVGAIMMWMNSAVPDGWFKLQGGTFDISIYPKLHTYLLATDGYTAGKLPDWKGRYPGEYGDHLAGVSLGKKLGQRTAKPNMGSPYSSKSIPNGSTRTFTATGNTNAYSDGLDRPMIDSGWDDVTRPPTVVVHYIIKHD